MQGIGAVVDDMSAPSDGIGTDERHPKSNEQQPMDAVAEALTSAHESLRAERRYRWLTVAIVLLFWVVQYTLFTIEAYIWSNTLMFKAFGARAIVSAWGVILSFGFVGILDSLRQKSLGVRAVAAVGLAICGAALQAGIIEGVLKELFPPEPHPSPIWMEYAVNFFARLWTFACFGGISVALSYAIDIREREQRIRALQALAHSAQLRALRFQLNPHFLFNALNSIAGLISAKRIGEAEAMTENIADFLRMTLALDPQQLITLDEELRLQSLYLEIEKKRFPDRLTIRIDVPVNLRTALVPGLVTQPLIENSVKYAVARSTRPVELAITARRLDDQLELIIADSGGDASETANKGARLGLRNVAERIHTHYGNRGNVCAEACAGGGFRNRILLPLDLRE
jgi:two-component sensor histidine kinase